MARCPKLDYQSNNWIGTSSDKYICKACGKYMDYDDAHVKYVCKSENGEEYKKCPIYQKAR